MVRQSSRAVGSPWGSTRVRDFGGDAMLWSALRTYTLQGQLATVPPCLAVDSGAKAWSDWEVERLHPMWPVRFLHQHRFASRVLRYAGIVALVVGLSVTAVGVKRYLYWQEVATAQIGEAVTVSKMEAWCRVNPWSRGCSPAKQKTGERRRGERRGR